MLKRIAAVVVTWGAFCSAAWAHPGHGHHGGDFGPLHYLTEPEHLRAGIPILLLLGLGAWSIRKTRRAQDSDGSWPQD